MPPSAQQRAHSCRESALAKRLEQALFPHRPICSCLQPGPFSCRPFFRPTRPLCTGLASRGRPWEQSHTGGPDQGHSPKLASNSWGQDWALIRTSSLRRAGASFPTPVLSPRTPSFAGSSVDAGAAPSREQKLACAGHLPCPTRPWTFSSFNLTGFCRCNLKAGQTLRVAERDEWTGQECGN